MTTHRTATTQDAYGYRVFGSEQGGKHKTNERIYSARQSYEFFRDLHDEVRARRIPLSTKQADAYKDLEEKLRFCEVITKSPASSHLYFLNRAIRDLKRNVMGLAELEPHEIEIDARLGTGLKDYMRPIENWAHARLDRIENWYIELKMLRYAAYKTIALTLNALVRLTNAFTVENKKKGSLIDEEEERRVTERRLFRKEEGRIGPIIDKLRAQMRYLEKRIFEDPAILELDAHCVSNMAQIDRLRLTPQRFEIDAKALQKMFNQAAFVSRLARGIGVRYVEGDGNPDWFVKEVMRLSDVLADFSTSFADAFSSAVSLTGAGKKAAEFSSELFARVAEAHEVCLALLTLMQGNVDDALAMRFGKGVVELEVARAELESIGFTAERELNLPMWAILARSEDPAQQMGDTDIRIEDLKTDLRNVEVEARLHLDGESSGNLQTVVDRAADTVVSALDRVVRENDYHLSFLDLKSAESELDALPRPAGSTFKARDVPLMVFFENGYSPDEKRVIFKRLMRTVHSDIFANDSIWAQATCDHFVKSFNAQYGEFSKPGGEDYQKTLMTMLGGGNP